MYKHLIKYLKIFSYITLLSLSFFNRIMFNVANKSNFGQSLNL
jgi:hypothetical protein